ncbi:MAG TPA: DNA topoisomerase IB [Candidatus Binatia bacterium]|nr:DNA topoisomerase IB [Candidatus Binatia bacterium]
MKSGKGFRYLDARGKTVRKAATLARIRALAIPPAWNDVWICPDPAGHLQATGRDARGRKQSRYHPRWREVRDATKYDRMLDFAKSLAAIRKRVARDLRHHGMQRDRVLATIVRLMDLTFIRVGNEEYARTNKSYGLTTLKNRHASVRASTVRFHFRGKSGKRHDIAVSDPFLARIVRRCQDIPGQDLFEYYDEDGKARDITSGDVNEYLREISGGDFTARDFRTWAGTVLALSLLRKCPTAASERAARKAVLRTVEQVAEKLGNTVSVCRKCYIHPLVLERFAEGAIGVAGRGKADAKVPAMAEVRRPRTGLAPDEKEALRFLRRCQRSKPTRAATARGRSRSAP